MTDKKFIIFSDDDDPDVECAENEDSQGNDDDRRRHPRYRVGVLTEIHTDDRGLLPGITFNMSESGAYLMTLVPLNPGDEVTLSFVSCDDKRETLQARVVHGTELTKDIFWSQGIGFEFVDTVPSFFKVEFEKE